MTETAKIVERLRATATGHPFAKIHWPHRLLHEAADEIERLAKLVAEAAPKHLEPLTESAREIIESARWD